MRDKTSWNCLDLGPSTNASIIITYKIEYSDFTRLLLVSNLGVVVVVLSSSTTTMIDAYALDTDQTIRVVLHSNFYGPRISHLFNIRNE
jgi:hypothetical protein